jgi:hypothetical protein
MVKLERISFLGCNVIFKKNSTKNYSLDYKLMINDSSSPTIIDKEYFIFNGRPYTLSIKGNFFVAQAIEHKKDE